MVIINALDNVRLNIELYRYSYKEGMNELNRDKRQLGYIAQEVRGVLPKAVVCGGCEGEEGDEGDEGILSIDITQINYTLYGAVKRLMEKYKEKKGRLERLERMVGGIG